MRSTARADGVAALSNGLSASSAIMMVRIIASAIELALISSNGGVSSLVARREQGSSPNEHAAMRPTFRPPQSPQTPSPPTSSPLLTGSGKSRLAQHAMTTTGASRQRARSRRRWRLHWMRSHRSWAKCATERLAIIACARTDAACIIRLVRGRNSVGRMPASQAGRRGFESHRPLCKFPHYTACENGLPVSAGHFSSSNGDHRADQDMRPILVADLVGSHSPNMPNQAGVSD